MDNRTQEKLQALFIDYTKRLPNIIQNLDTHWQQLCEHYEAQSFADFHRAVHTLCGTSGTYGYTALSKSARQLEVYLKPLLNESSLDNDKKTKITHLLNQLQISIQDSEQSNEFASPLSVSTSNKLIYVVDQDEYFLSELKNELTQASYEMQQFNQFPALLEALQKIPPAALVVDMNFLNDETIKELLALEKENDLVVPLFCMSTNGDLVTRLQAIRAGCKLFLEKPIDTFYLTKTLDLACGFASTDPFRILIIDDSPSLAEYYSLILQDAGMLTQTLSSPLQAIETIIEFKPDLLLLDIYMPECSGIELAGVLRQSQKYTHLPIIFLSSEGDKFKQLAALGLGGDDFLTKPILPQHLVAAVRTRAKRAGILSSYMTRDSLTSLLNHTNLLHQLDIELMHATRLNLQLAFVMIDIDLFKSVNDRFGHLMGDRVLKKLSEMLISRFRKNDSVGRYGGEEFAVILPNTHINDARKLLDHLRDKFSKIRFNSETEEFSVSFSVGIASFPKFKTAHALIEAADQAMYKAKQNGRNQVVIV